MASRYALVRGSSLSAAACITFAMLATPARADEGGASIYLLGSGAPNSAVQPPLRGLYLDDTVYVYDGSAGAQRNFLINGKLVANVHATIVADFYTALWVPSTNFLGGTLSLGGAMPVAAPMIDASAVLNGPNGQALGVQKHDSTLAIGDPLAMASLGWKSGKLNVAVSGFANIPVGYYREGQLANIAFHRWAGDASLAASWHDEESGWDISGKVGFTFNGTNDVTDYTSGTDLHFEAGIEKALNKKFSIGALGYYFQQISDDSGSGATLGGFRGRVAALGGTIAYNTVLGRAPSTFRVRLVQEFDAQNRLEGTGGFLSLTLPLSMKMPGH